MTRKKFSKFLKQKSERRLLYVNSKDYDVPYREAFSKTFYFISIPGYRRKNNIILIIYR